MAHFSPFTIGELRRFAVRLIDASEQDYTYCNDESGDCPDHGRRYGKFDSCLDETVWSWSLEDYDGFGDTDLDGYFVYVHLTGGDLASMLIPYRAAIVQTTSSGAVSVQYFDSQYKATEYWDNGLSDYRKRYEEWCYADEGLYPFVVTIEHTVWATNAYRAAHLEDHDCTDACSTEVRSGSMI